MANKLHFNFKPDLFTPCIWTQNYYDKINEKYFNYGLPNVSVGFYKDKKNDDCYGCSFTPYKAKFVHTIALNPLFTEWTKVVRTTILHEAVHVKLMGKHGHGPKFKKELRRLILAGAFDDLL